MLCKPLVPPLPAAGLVRTRILRHPGALCKQRSITDKFVDYYSLYPPASLAFLTMQPLIAQVD